MKPGTQVRTFGGQVGTLISNNEDGTATVDIDGVHLEFTGTGLSPGPAEEVATPKKHFPPLTTGTHLAVTPEVVGAVVDTMASELTGEIVRQAIRQSAPEDLDEEKGSSSEDDWA